MQSVNVPEPMRFDCAERYDSIRDKCQVVGKTVIDIGCGNGYFMARFLNDGCDVVVGIDPDDQYKFPNTLRSVSDLFFDFDICLYLDLHYHNGINYFPWIKKHARLAFISPSGVGNNEVLQEDLIKEFGNCEFVGRTSYANRNIYKVINELN